MTLPSHTVLPEEFHYPRPDCAVGRYKYSLPALCCDVTNLVTHFMNTIDILSAWHPACHYVLSSQHE